MSDVDTSPLVTSVERYFAGSRRFEVRMRELTRLQPEWARLRFLCCEICHFDKSDLEGAARPRTTIPRPARP